MFSKFLKKYDPNSVIRKGRYNRNRTNSVNNKRQIEVEKTEPFGSKVFSRIFTVRNAFGVFAVFFLASNLLKGKKPDDLEDDYITKIWKKDVKGPTTKLVVKRIDDKITDYDAAFIAASKNMKAGLSRQLQYGQMKIIDAEFDALSETQIQQLLQVGRKAREVNALYASATKNAWEKLRLPYVHKAGEPLPVPPIVSIDKSNPGATSTPETETAASSTAPKIIIDPKTGKQTVVLTETKAEQEAEMLMLSAVQAKIKNEIMLMKSIELILNSRQQTQLALLTNPNLVSMIASNLLKLDMASKYDFILDKIHKLEIMPTAEAPKVYVISFKGDIGATQVEKLREEITGILSVCNKERGDQVVLNLTSPGGAVSGYGLAAAQLSRFKTAQIPLTVCVDVVAASGGYMMACVGDKIIASPFALLGSIGVIATIPNFANRMHKEGFDVEDITAGKYKRTMTPYKQNTPQDRAKMKSDIEDIFSLFKDFVKVNRPSLDIEDIATGETWYGPDALKRGLCDELLTSDDLIMSLRKSGREVYTVELVTTTVPTLFGPSASIETIVGKYLSDILVKYVTNMLNENVTGTMNSSNMLESMMNKGMGQLGEEVTSSVPIHEKYMAYDVNYGTGRAPRI